MKNNNSKILIVDDDTRNIFALSAVLKSRGYSCITANSADDAFTILEQDPGINIVLMDMMMPDMDGYDAIRKIRKEFLNPPPVVAVTAQAMTGDREKCLEAGADDYISKPVDADRLFAMLETLIK